MRRIIFASILLLVGVLAVPAEAAESFTVSGVVQGDGDRPLAGTDVTFYLDHNDEVAATRTDSAGRYEVRLPPGTYGAKFEHAQGGYITEFFDDQAEGRYSSPTGASLEVVDRDVREVSAHLVRPATVRGRLLAGDRPVDGYFVDFRRRVAGSDYVSDHAQNADGTFEFTGVTPGDYGVVLHASKAPAGYDDTTGFVVSVPSGGSVTVPTQRLTALKDLGKVEAKVTSGQGKLALFTLPSGLAIRDETVQKSPSTVTFSELPAGTYVMAGDRLGWIGGHSIHTARRIVVKPGRTTKVPAALSKPKGFAFRVMNRRGSEIPGVTARVFRVKDPTEVVAVAATDGGGNIEMDGLPRDDYRVVLDDPSGEYERRTILPPKSDPFELPVVTMGHRTPLAPMSKDRSASLAIDRQSDDWTIYSADDSAVPIYAPTKGSDDSERKFVAPGTYKLKLNDGGWYGGVSFREATPVTLAAGDRKSLTVGYVGSTGTLQGTVRASDADYVQSAVVTVYRAESRTVVDRVRTDREFDVLALPVRKYKIQVTDPTGRHLTRWVGGGTSFDTAATFTPHISDGTSVGTTTLPLAFVAVTAPTVKGTAVVGKALSATSGKFTKSYSYAARKWLRDGKAIKGATSTRYRLTASDVGHRITYSLSVRRKGGDPTATSVSAPTAVVMRR